MVSSQPCPMNQQARSLDADARVSRSRCQRGMPILRNKLRAVTTQRHPCVIRHTQNKCVLPKQTRTTHRIQDKTSCSTTCPAP
eukprot:4846133-Amphidinium_carterae.1